MEQRAGGSEFEPAVFRAASRSFADFLDQGEQCVRIGLPYVFSVDDSRRQDFIRRKPVRLHKRKAFPAFYEIESDAVKGKRAYFRVAVPRIAERNREMRFHRALPFEYAAVQAGDEETVFRRKVRRERGLFELETLRTGLSKRLDQGSVGVREIVGEIVPAGHFQAVSGRVPREAQECERPDDRRTGVYSERFRFQIF